MFGRTARRERAETRTEPGVSLARGPALIAGAVLLAAGLYFLYKQPVFARLANFPDGQAPGQGHKVFFGIFGANGWTGMLTAIGGGLLLFGAAQHLLAKTMSLLVGVALGAAAIIAVANSGNVLGLAVANVWTEIGWGVVAAILLFNTLIPRRRTTVATDYDRSVGPPRDSSAVPPASATERDRVAGRQPPVDEDPDRRVQRDSTVANERDSALATESPARER